MYDELNPPPMNPHYIGAETYIKILTIQVSAPIYWGFRYKVPIDYALSVVQTVLEKEIKDDMKRFFSLHNLEELKDGVDKLNLHFHQTISKDDDIVYICDHK